MSWRLNWALRQLADLRGYQKQSRTLQSPAQFYFAMLKKLIPGLFPAEIMLRLKGGNAIPVREFMTLYIYKEIFVDHCYDVAINKSDPLILDIGANPGLFTLRMKQLFPNASIRCNEPFPPNFEQLKQTISANNIDRVVMVQKAVGGRAGSARLYIHKRNVGGHSLFAVEASSNDYINVEVLELGRILDELQSDVDVLKADCEGAEFDILMGITSEDAKRIRQVIIEPTPKLYDVKQLITHMTSLGYSHRWRDGLFLFSRSPPIW